AGEGLLFGGWNGTAYLDSILSYPLANEPPLAEARLVQRGLALSADATTSRDLDGRIVAFHWTWGDGNASDGAVATHAYATPGRYVVRLVVTDDRGATAERAFPVDLAESNRPPVAAFSATRTARDVRFDAAASSDPDGDPLTFRWTFGDGTEGVAGVLVRHGYAAPGTYAVVLEVTDANGARAVARHTVEIPPPAPPTAQFAPVVVGRLVLADATASTHEEGPPTYAWDWGDGTSSAEGSFARHRYAASGTYRIVLTVRDGAGRAAVAERDVEVGGPAPPTAAFEVTRRGRAVEVDASRSGDPDGSVASFAWSWGDGTDTVGNATATHAYAAPGAYRIRLVVVDSDGLPANATRDVTIPEGAGPASRFDVIVDGLSVRVDVATGPDDPDADVVVRYAWDWGDGTPPGEGRTASHSYAREGRYVITLRGIDGLGPPVEAMTHLEVGSDGPVPHESTPGPGLPAMVGALAAASLAGIAKVKRRRAHQGP
ncbi:MAG: PKD domain-containing protein, partial [Methanobacteriota archaeon]